MHNRQSFRSNSYTVVVAVVVFFAVMVMRMYKIQSINIRVIMTSTMTLVCLESYHRDMWKVMQRSSFVPVEVTYAFKYEKFEDYDTAQYLLKPDDRARIDFSLQNIIGEVSIVDFVAVLVSTDVNILVIVVILT
ncbi:Hypothetical predicted protein [Octopus vulgaris]|uniref:Uncharacterized protein n=1 Tax=Octopus vulgaris TaxID=6645 RepID=A0AA36F676_OCTVU|nr:Hypothetical predicted protein [Octopus vulgaris]